MQQETTGISRRTLSMVSAGFVLCLASGLMSAGCGSSEGRILVPVPDGTPENPVPESTLSYLKECAERWGDDLEKRSYTIKFNLTITKNGGVSHVEPTGTRLDVPEMERCMIGALRMMSVPAFVMEKASSERVSQHMPAHARGLIGQSDVMDDVLFPLAPVIIRAGPWAIVVVLGVVVVAAAVKYADKEMERRCKEEKEKARELCEELLGWRDPPRGVTGGYQKVLDCMPGLISWECGGNKVEEGPQGRPGRKH